MLHPNVVLFDVTVGWLTVLSLPVPRNGLQHVGQSAMKNAQVKIPTLPNSREGWGTLQLVPIEIVGSITLRKVGHPCGSLTMVAHKRKILLE